MQLFDAILNVQKYNLVIRKSFYAVNRTRPLQCGTYNLQSISACAKRVWPCKTINYTYFNFKLFQLYIISQMTSFAVWSHGFLFYLKNLPYFYHIVGNHVTAVDWYQSDHKLFTGLSQYLVSLSDLELLGYSILS